MSSKTRHASGEDDQELLWARRLASLDRYLRATGVKSPTKRLYLARRVAQDLKQRTSCQEEFGWAEIVAAVDRCLSLEQGFDFGGDAQMTYRGRIAQYCCEVADDRRSSRAKHAQRADWAVPTKCHRPMPTQELDLPRFFMQWRWPAQLRRPAQGLAIGFCCLAVVLIP